MCHICPNHECAHFRLIFSIFETSEPTCIMFSPPLFSRYAWTKGPCRFCLVNIGPHGSYATWKDERVRSQEASPM